MESLERSAAEGNERYKGKFVAMELGGYPFPWLDGMDFSEKEQGVVAIDVNKDREGFRRGYPKRENVAFEPVQTNITKREFMNSDAYNGAVDFLIANNMVGELYPISEGTVSERFMQGLRSLQGKKESFTPRIVAKISALLKPGGRAVIGQWNTPDFGDELYAMKDEEWAAFGLRRTLVTSADEVRKLLEEDLHVDKKERGRVLKYFDGTSRTTTPPFILVLEKTETAASVNAPRSEAAVA